MVKTFDNYGFARDAWSFLVAPAWYHGVVRVGSLSTAGVEAGGGGGGGNKARSLGPQQMSAPVRPGALVYAQEVRVVRFERDRRVGQGSLRRLTATGQRVPNLALFVVLWYNGVYTP